MQDVNGKVAAITGGASGIGRAMGECFARAGMRVALADVDESGLERAVGDLRAAGAEAIGVACDVTRPDDVQRLADETRAALGAVHVACNNAGVAPMGSVLETPLEDWRWLMDVNVLGVAYGTSVFGKIFVDQGEGHIVNTASGAGLMPTPGLGAYAATKHAVVGMSETLYYELQDSGVGISILCPGLVDTAIFRSERNRPKDGGPRSYGRVQERAEKLLSKAGHPPERIAEAVLSGIREDRLWILPHPDVKPAIETRHRHVIDGTNPDREDHFDLRKA